MALNSKLMKQLKQAQKRRERRPEPEIVDLPSLKVKNSERSRFTQRAAPLLLAIEKTLVGCADENPQVDDAQVAAALVAAIRGSDPRSELQAYLLAKLELSAEENQADSQDWQTGLRIIYSSASTVSDCKSGSRDYLNHAGQFVRRAQQRSRLT